MLAWDKSNQLRYGSASAFAVMLFLYVAVVAIVFVKVPGRRRTGVKEDFFVTVAMGTEPVMFTPGSVLFSAAPLDEDGWLQPNNAAWVLRG